MNKILSHLMAGWIAGGIVFIVMLTTRNINLTAQDIDTVETVRILSDIQSISIDNYGFDRNWQVNIYLKKEAGKINLESENKDLTKAIQEIIQKYNQINGECE